MRSRAASTHETKQIDIYKALGQDGIKLVVEATADFESRRKKIERFKFHVTNRLDDVARMIAMGFCQFCSHQLRCLHQNGSTYQ